MRGLVPISLVLLGAACRPVAVMPEPVPQAVVRRQMEPSA